MMDTLQARPEENSILRDIWKLILVVLGVSVLRCLLAASIPLFAVEAYYWLWGQYPAAGYYDHPPMVGLMSAVFFGWIDGNELAARSGPIVLGALASFAVYGFTRSLFSQGRIALYTAVLCTVTPLFDLNGMILQPDNSLILFMVLTWWGFWCASDQKQGEQRMGLWLLTGILAGCALLSKFHAWVLLPPLWLFPVISPPHRRVLRTPGPWLAALTALVVLSPNLWWNAQHDWINYSFQWRRSSLPEASVETENIFEYLVGPFLFLSPLLFIAVVGGVVKGFRQYLRERSPRILFLLLAGLPLPIFLGILSPFVSISPHWPATAYIPLVVLTVPLLLNGDLFSLGYRKAMWAVCIVMLAVVHVAPYLVLHLPDNLSGPFRPGHSSIHRLKREYVGWEEIGQRVRKVRDEMDSVHPTMIMADGWHFASMLAFYSGLPKECFAFEKENAHNFLLWLAERGGLKEHHAVVAKKSIPEKHSPIGLKMMRYAEKLDSIFEHAQPDPALIIYEDGSAGTWTEMVIEEPRIREFLLFRCYLYTGMLYSDDLERAVPNPWLDE